MRSTTLLIVRQGTSWSRDFLVTDVHGEPVDLTSGYRARAQLRRRPSGAAVLYTWDSDTANCELTADGVILLTLEAAETTGWSFRRAVWDLELTDSDGAVERVDSGELHVLPEVTR